MTLEELIATLTAAQEQATEGEWSVSHSDRQATYAHSDGWDRIVANVRNPKNMEAIATFRNTAGEVLRQLHEFVNVNRAHVDDVEARCVAEERAEKAEAKVSELEKEVARLDAGWHHANGRVLEVGLERTQLKAERDEARARIQELENKQ